MANEVNIKITANDLASGKISKLRKGISGVNSTIENNRRGMLAAGAASVAFGTLAVRAAADFDKGMREVNTLINFSNRELDLLGYQVRELAKDFGINAVDATKALYSAISAGQEPAEAIEFLGVAAKTSIGGVTDLETAVLLQSSMLSVMNHLKRKTLPTLCLRQCAVVKQPSVNCPISSSKQHQYPLLLALHLKNYLHQ